MITAATSVSLCVLCGTLPTSARIAWKAYEMEHNSMSKTIAIFAFAAAVTSAAVPARASSLPAWADLQQRLDAGGDIRLSCDVVAEEGDKTLSVTNSVTLDLAGHTLVVKVFIPLT